MIRTIIAAASLALLSTCSAQPVTAKTAIVKISNEGITPAERQKIADWYAACPRHEVPCLEHAIYWSGLRNRIEFQVIMA